MDGSKKRMVMALWMAGSMEDSLENSMGKSMDDGIERLEEMDSFVNEGKRTMRRGDQALTREWLWEDDGQRKVALLVFDIEEKETRQPFVKVRQRGQAGFIEIRARLCER